jgi:hypothetical protein
MSDASDFDPGTVRLHTQIGSDLISAECLRPGCGWSMYFSHGAFRLSTVLEVSAAHPCQPAPPVGA